MAQLTHRRSELLAMGFDDRSIAKALRGDHSELVRLLRGTYSTRESLRRAGTTTNKPATADVEAEAAWLVQLDAHLRRSGPTAVVGLRSAARLHDLDGYRETPHLDTLTAAKHHVREAYVHRTRTLNPHDVISLGGFQCTSLERTLLDLGRVCTADEVEFALESALRDPDPKRPDRFDRHLLNTLTQRVEVVGPRTGAAVIRQVLRRRLPVGCRPTGSYAETALGQGFRKVGLHQVVRQADVTFLRRGEIDCRYFADFLFPDRLLIVEVNGAAPRAGATMTAGDVARMNVLQDVFRVHIVSGRDAVQNPYASASVVLGIFDTVAPVSFPLTKGGRTVQRTATGIDIHLP